MVKRQHHHPRSLPTSGEGAYHWRMRQLGQTLVEFALVAPVLLLLIGATVDMGRGVLINNLLSGASRETARA